MPNKIQSREYSRDGVMEGVLRKIDSDGNRHLFNVNRTDDGKRWLNTNNDNAGNVWNPGNRFVFARRNSFHFSPRASLGEFSFLYFTKPTAQVSSNLIQFFQKFNIFFII